MMNRIQWYPIALRLRDFMANYKTESGKQAFDYLVDRQDLKIKVGTGNVGEWPAIWILLGSEENINKQDKIIGAIIQLWIDIYVKGERSDYNEYDDILYKQAYQVEQDILTMLNEFTILLAKDFGIAANIVVPAIYSDGDENAPTNVQHRIIVNIGWRMGGMTSGKLRI